MNEAFRLLFDHVKSGVIWMQRDGVVRYANKAAVQLTPCLLGQPLLDVVAQRAVRDAGANLLQLPYRFDLQSTEIHGDLVHAVVLPAPVGKDLMLVLDNVTEASWYQQALGNLVAYIDAEMGEPIAQLGMAVQSLQGDAQAGALATAAQQLSAKLHALGALVQVFGSEGMVQDERILLPELLREAQADCADLLERRHVHLKGDGLKQDLAVYGSNQWLRRALVEFLSQAIASVPRGAVIALSLEGMGTRVLLRAASKGLYLSAHERRGGEVPFGVGDGSGQAHAAPRIGLAMARAIVERHGGVVRIDDTHDSVDFVLELPAGAPAEQPPQLAVEQAQRYAHDMARLLARQAARRGKEAV